MGKQAAALEVVDMRIHPGYAARMDDALTGYVILQDSDGTWAGEEDGEPEAVPEEAHRPR